jgi:hypothetical protein
MSGGRWHKRLPMYVNIGYYDVAQKRAVLYSIRKAPDSYVAAAAREVLREIARRAPGEHEVIRLANVLRREGA